ncbi:Uncharacterised protein [Streptobacillus moniliformis]|nr:Uncharacterised protein [Streptobacillus moniliformis]
MSEKIFHSKSEAELRERIKELITLAEDETIVIKELKKPFKFLFFSMNGKYSVNIVKKGSEKEKIVNKPVKKEQVKKTNVKKEKPVKKQVVKAVSEKDKKADRLNIVIKEFLATANLNISIKEITVTDNIYKVELIGDEIRYIIGEKGISLVSLEYLLMSLEEFKNVKIFIDSNNYKEKERIF